MTLLYNRINGETVLHKAVNQGATEIVKVRFSARVYLTQSGVTVIREGGGGVTPSMLGDMDVLPF